MTTKNELTITVKSRYPDEVINGIKSFCTELGYKPISQCSCSEEITSVETTKVKGIKKLKGEAELTYKECVDCLHYGIKPGLWSRKRKEKEGVVFVVESSKSEGATFSLVYSKRKRQQLMGTVSLNSVNASNRELGTVSCYAYGGKYSGKDYKSNFECQKNRNWGEKLKLPPVIKSLGLIINQDIELSEKLYDFYTPRDFRYFKGCYDKPKSLSKHLAASDLLILSDLILGEQLNLKEANALEETTYVTIGLPHCWKNHGKLRFISKKQIDIPDEILLED